MLFARKPPAYSDPGHCLILPGKRSDEDGGIQLQTQLDGIRGPITGWLSFTGIRQIADRHPELGLSKTADLEAATERAEIAEGKLADAEARIAELEADQERIIGLRRAGFTVQKTQSRQKARS